ncbi:MAG TPA: CHASE2 domain-containing protein [Vicinamibacterales bacterium]|nr:CHASE2 domain-containing protein [Vicinamibacterales bacterium]
MTRRSGIRATPWALVPMAFTAALSVYRPSLLLGTERATYDALLRHDRARQPGGRVVIVDIDDRSLSTLGQWPWRRSVVADLVSRLRAAGAASVALDVLLAEPERSATPGETTDSQLAETLRQGGIVTGYAFTFDHPSETARPCPRQSLGLAILGGSDGDADPFFRAADAICSLPVFTDATTASGFLNASPDSDGVLRRVPLLLQYRGRVYPSFALAAVAAATHGGGDVLRIANANAVTLQFGDRTVPLDGKSHLLVRYRGVKRTFPYVSALDVLNGSAASNLFADKIVFVGTTALGTREVVATPLDTLFAAVEVHASVADNLLRGDFLHRPEHAVMLETMTAIGAGALIALLAMLFGVIASAVGCVLLVAGAWVGSAALVAANGTVISPLFPTIAGGGTFALLAASQLAFERRRADRASAEKDASRRMMIQSLLSLTETRDAETGQHSRRTRRNMRILAEELAKQPDFRRSLTPERIELLSSLAPLHDIGKVGVADRVLSKPAALTETELAEIRRHPDLGRNVIDRAQSEMGDADDEDGVLELAKEIVYTHHEKWDGTGYPQGLRGEDIPLSGRLMAVVDVYDAAVTERRYHSAVSHDDALKIIAEGRGTHFDPAVVDAFLAVSVTLCGSHDSGEPRKTPPRNGS